MRRIKIKLPFDDEKLSVREKKLKETADILSDFQRYLIVEEKHYTKLSTMTIYVIDEVIAKRVAMMN
jgi:hypothetical protein